LLNAVGFSHNIAKELSNAIIQMQETRTEGEENSLKLDVQDSKWHQK